MSSEDVFSYLSGMKRKYSSLSARFAECETLWQKKLFHQLTEVVEAILRHPDLKKNQGLREFYTKFLKDFETKINAQKFMEFAIIISKEYNEKDAAIAFLRGVGENVQGQEAYILPLTEIATLRLSLNDVEACRNLLDEAKSILDEVAGTNNVLHGSYYKAAALCFKARDMTTEFYKHGLMYLGCANLTDIPENERADIAFDLGLAALLSDSIYNFGELLAHPILSSLENTGNAWMVPVLRSFNAGRVNEYRALTQKYAAQMNAVAALKSSMEFLNEKVTLLCFVELLFARPPLQRANVSFDDISRESGVPKDQVEHLVMKALSLSLIRGVINQVDEQVSVSWVQHRYLDEQQLSKMSARLQEWSNSVDQTLVLMESETSELVS